MRQLKYLLAILFVLSLSVSVCYALDTERTFRLSFDHLLYMSNISTSPLEIYPGKEANLSFRIENTGDQFIRDIRIDLEMPVEFAPYQDISRRKIAQMNAGDSEIISFNILPLPQTEDGIYKMNILAQYINYVGDERGENNTISIIVGSSPKLLAELSSSSIYKGNTLGDVKIKVINNNVGNVKFLQVNLGESKDYTILGSSMDYVGDLDSDDFSDVSFRINVQDDVKTLELPITLSYKDALNKDYTQEIKVQFEIPSAAEAGIKKSSGGLVVIIIILAIVGFIIYRRYNKNIMKQKKALAHSFNTKF